MLYHFFLNDGKFKTFLKTLMKISWKRKTKSLLLKIVSLYVPAALLICIGCCCQGDDARPVSVVPHVTPVTCHVIFEKTQRNRHVTKACGCKCWIWCKDSMRCDQWSFYLHTQLLQPHLEEQKFVNKILTTACNSCCERNLNSSILYTNPSTLDIECNSIHDHSNSSYCDKNDQPNWCCSVFCSDDQSEGHCLYLYPDTTNSYLEILPTHNNIRYIKNIPVFNNHTVNKRSKSNSNSELPYHIQVLGNLGDFTAHQPFNVGVQLLDEFGIIVPDSGHKIKLTIRKDGKISKSRKKRNVFTSVFENGKANFSNVTIKDSGTNYVLSVESRDRPEVLRWTSDRLTVNHRPLTLRSSGRTLPISPRENETLSPAAGVIIYDEMNGGPANKSLLAKYTWKASIKLLYEDIYPGKLLGTTSKLVKGGSNEILFDNVEISNWGYSYILNINIISQEEPNWNLTHQIGPFDVDKFDTFELPLVESEDFRAIKVVFDSDYKIIKKDERKFEIFFLNQFGTKYADVRWKNITLSRGSIIVDAIITGLPTDLERTSKLLESAIEKGEADVVYENNMLRANKVFFPSRKLLAEGGSSESSDEGGGGLSVAWIVAIAVNVILIALFLLAIVYCYCRRKKQKEVTRSVTTIQNFDEGPNPLLFANKAENQISLQDKAAIFTIEDSKVGKHKSMSGKIHRDGERCTCQSPTCYCSVGDGRKSEMTYQHSEEENEDDPQGYPTPSPEPRFPTPEPTPEPEDYWRPDSSPQQEEPEDEMYLPGAVSEPSPEPPQEERFYVYLLTSYDGSRELVGQIYLKVDSFLSEARREMDRDRDLSDVIQGREYRFLDENMDAIANYQESSLDLERIFSSQHINIQFIPPKTPTPMPEPPPRPKLPAYVGPLGICTAPDCTRAAKIKCLDCRNVAYCTKRCMMEDAKDHKRVCYKPAWRV